MPDMTEPAAEAQPEEPAPTSTPPVAKKGSLSAPRTIALIAVAIAVLCCGGLLSAGYLVFRLGSESTKPVRESSEAFLDNLEEGDFPHAYEQLCARTRGQYSLEQFKAVAGAKRLQSYAIKEVSAEKVNGVQSGTVQVELTYAGSPAETRTILFAKEGSTWRVCGSPY